MGVIEYIWKKLLEKYCFKEFFMKNKILISSSVTIFKMTKINTVTFKLSF